MIPGERKERQNEMSNTPKATAVGLYAVLARDISDFIELVREDENVPESELLDLYLMLTLDNPGHSKDTKQLNKIGSEMVERALKRRGLTIPEPLKAEVKTTGPKETVYDNEISPLMKQILDLCKANNINMVAVFYLDPVQGCEEETIRCKNLLARDRADKVGHAEVRDIYEYLERNKN